MEFLSQQVAKQLNLHGNYVASNLTTSVSSNLLLCTEAFVSFMYTYRGMCCSIL